MRWAVGLGGLCGLIAGGIGSRIVMRVIARADPSSDGTFTDAEATVGELTAGGTFTLLVLGTVAGAVAGPVYLGVRRWLPVPPAWKGIAFGVLTLVTVGNLLFDPDNADFQIFEPVILVIALFSGLFLLNGWLLGALMARFHPAPARARARGTRTSWAATGVLVVVCVVGGLVLVGGTVGMVEDEGTCLSAAGGGNGCALVAQP